MSFGLKKLTPKILFKGLDSRLAAVLKTNPFYFNSLSAFDGVLDKSKASELFLIWFLLRVVLNLVSGA